jgi:hypothetical protein
MRNQIVDFFASILVRQFAFWPFMRAIERFAPFFAAGLDLMLLKEARLSSFMEI